ncbi:MAG: radical SAM protein [Clostridiales bacterium]|nr:radical SAM protein [Clostridiales bacterium]
MICTMCPRKCNVDRNVSVGFCGEKDKIRINKIMLHKFEEPIISGKDEDKGSGAIFFVGCNLKCVFCQNGKISRNGVGIEFSSEELAEKFKELEKMGALNINLVTPTHFYKQIIEAFKIYQPKIPVVWNSSGYETKEMVEEIAQFVDIFLVDLKYMDNEIALKYSKAKDYVEVVAETIKSMRKLKPNDIIENGLMKKGVIIRHLILPTHTADSIKVLDFIHDNLGENTIVSIMSQYTPFGDLFEHPEINRKITPLEYKRVVNHALKLNMMNCFTQDLKSANKMFTPDFD